MLSTQKNKQNLQIKKFFLLISLVSFSTYSQTFGCTDLLSKTYNPKATQNDGNCLYAATKTKTIYSKTLSDSIQETSGLIAFDHLLWTHNDDLDTTLYGMNLNGIIQKKINLPGVKNVDWEEISQDSSYLYIGDFGNNYKGNRTDLHILKIDKKSFLTNNPIVDTIAFSYSKQSNFEIQTANTTDFDCEAFVVLQDGIYLFTKEWTSQKTNVYHIPKTPGKHIAQHRETLNIQGLITGATIIPEEKGILLCGYSKILKPFLYLLYDYSDNYFSNGNKRKISIALPFHQIEGIATEDGLTYYITNEATYKPPFITTKQKIHQLDLSDYLKKYLSN
jgi:hypothetical protein